jgi:hypothetical protein
MRLPRLTEVDVHIDEARRHDKPRRLHNLDIGRLLLRAGRINDQSIANPKIADLVAFVGGIDDSPAGNTNDLHEERPTPPAQQ